MRIPVLILPLLIAACASVPEPHPQPVAADQAATPRIIGAHGPLSRQESKALLARLGLNADNADLLRTHLAIENDIADTPLIAGNDVRLLRDGEPTFAAMFQAIRSARHHVNLEYFIFDDIRNGGQSLSDLLVNKRKEGVAVNVIYDGFGSATTPKPFFEKLQAAGVKLVEYNPINPLNPVSTNHRDHRKILVADGVTAIVGGINMSLSYEPSRLRRSAVESLTPSNARWRDTDMLIKGPAVAELQKIYMQHWQEQKGPAMEDGVYFPKATPRGDEVIRIIGSAPSKELPRYYLTLLSAINNADQSIYLSAAYFVPTRQERQLLIDAAKRGVDVRLLLPSVSDSPSAIEVQHSHYDDLLEAGIKIYETQNEILHAKTVTIDGVWSILGSSNFDHRSVLFNDEVDVVALGRETARELKRMFDDDMKTAKRIELKDWKQRPALQNMKDHVARFWEEML
jgi:cardiolipin synthase